MISAASSHEHIAHRGLHEVEQRIAIDDEANDHDLFHILSGREIGRHVGPSVNTANGFGRVVRHREQAGHKRIGQRSRFDDGVQEIARGHGSRQCLVSDVANLPASRFGGSVVDLLSCRFLDGLQEHVDRHGKARDEVQALAAPNVARKSDDFPIDLGSADSINPSLCKTERILYSRAFTHGLYSLGYEFFISGIGCPAFRIITSYNHKVDVFSALQLQFCNCAAPFRSDSPRGVNRPLAVPMRLAATDPQRTPATQSRPMERVAAGGLIVRQVGSPAGGRRTAAVFSSFGAAATFPILSRNRQIVNGEVRRLGSTQMPGRRSIPELLNPPTAPVGLRAFAANVGVIGESGGLFGVDPDSQGSQTPQPNPGAGRGERRAIAPYALATWALCREQPNAKDAILSSRQDGAGVASGRARISFSRRFIVMAGVKHAVIDGAREHPTKILMGGNQ